MSATPICECPCGCSADATGEHRSRGTVRQTCDACAGHIDAQDAAVVVFVHPGQLIDPALSAYAANFHAPDPAADDAYLPSGWYRVVAGRFYGPHASADAAREVRQ